MERASREQAQLDQITQWQDDLAALAARIAPRFVRPEVRDRAGRFLAGLLGPVERRNGWQLAEQLGERGPDGVQRLLRSARWDAEAVRDDLRSYVVEHLGDPAAVLVIDETGFLKKGTHSAGVARQYSGTAGRIENCQIGVFLAYASPRGRAFLDRALYLPKAWAQDAARRQDAGIPPEVAFATKGELARAFAADVPAGWVTGDEVYGNDGGLRRWLEAEERPYVLAVARSHAVWHNGVQGRVDALVEDIPGDGWQRIDVGAGSKGPRLYDWAWGRLPYLTDDGWVQWLLIRRSISHPEKLAFYRAYGREESTIADLARVAGRRWSIEEAFQRAKTEWVLTSTRCAAGRGGIGTSRLVCWRMPSWRSRGRLSPPKKGGRCPRPDPGDRPGSAALAGRAAPLTRAAPASAALVRLAAAPPSRRPSQSL